MHCGTIKVKNVRIISPLDQSLNSVPLLNHRFNIDQLVKLNTSIVNTHKYITFLNITTLKGLL